MTGQGPDRQIVSRPAATSSAAPATARPRQAVPVMTTLARKPEIGAVPPVPPEPPAVTEPAPVPDPASPLSPALLAAARIAAAPEMGHSTDAAAPAPNSMSSPPASRRARPRVAITAARVASPAMASALAAGTRSCPVTVTLLPGSGRGADVCTCAQPWRTPRNTRPAPAAPSSSTSPYSQRGESRRPALGVPLLIRCLLGRCLPVTVSPLSPGPRRLALKLIEVPLHGIYPVQRHFDRVMAAEWPKR